jgi:hypothetical protein
VQELHTQIEIEAPAERVWKLLTDFDSFPQWNSFIPRLSGEPVEGSKLEVDLRPPGGRGLTIRPTVLKSEPNREFRWLGHLGMPGLFDGEHSFVIEPVDGNRVRFHHGERFTGVLTPLVLRFVGESTKQGFEAMNRALKERAESRGGAT